MLDDCLVSAQLGRQAAHFSAACFHVIADAEIENNECFEITKILQY